MEEVRREVKDATLGGLQQTKSSSEEFEPLVVIEFAVNTNRAAIEWMIAKLQASRQNNGADLSVKAMVMQHNEETVLFVGATTERLLLAAEMTSVMKPYKDDTPREFTIRDLENFRGGDNPDSFLTMAEKQQLILHELEGMRATGSDEHVPGYEFVKLYSGRTIGE